MYEYRALVTRVIDADTFEARVDLGFGIAFDARRGQAIKSIRVLGIDAPELNTEAGQLARARAVELMEGKGVVVRTVRMPTTDNFGRYLADVLLPDGQSLTALLIAEGHAAPYGY